MRFTVTFDTDNADFDGDPIDFTEAVAETLERVADDIGLQEIAAHQPDGGSVYDRNGNTIGKWELK